MMKETAIEKLIKEIRANLAGIWVVKNQSKVSKEELNKFIFKNPVSSSFIEIESNLSEEEIIGLSAQEKTLKYILYDLKSKYLEIEKQKFKNK